MSYICAGVPNYVFIAKRFRSVLSAAGVPAIKFFLSAFSSADEFVFHLPVAQRVNCRCDCAQPFLRYSGAFLTVTFIVQANIQAGRIPKQPNITVFPFSINELELKSDKKGNIRR